MPTARRAKIFPFLWFPKDAEGAARFYASIFPNSRVNSVAVMQSESPSGPPGSVNVVDFTLLGQRFQAMTAGPHDPFNDAMSIMVECDDQAELDRYWKKLLEGGGKEVACGWLTDRYGVRWQLTPRVLNDMLASKDKAASKRASDAMMQMVKLDIAKLEAAFEGEREAAPKRARRSKSRGGEARARRSSRRR